MIQGQEQDVTEEMKGRRVLLADGGMKSLQEVAYRHRKFNKFKKSHHAAAVVVDGVLIGDTVSVNRGIDHAEVSALRRALNNGWCVQRGYTD